jgi:pyrimidine-nucleoside phosphorylase
MTAAEMRRAIARKRDGQPLAAERWAAIVAGYVAGEIEEAQVAALLMACVFQPLDEAETEALAAAMVASGETLPAAAANCVDKHSSGGVSDGVSLVVVPWVAACGVPVAKLSGRALGHTGGTLDKLEAVRGVRTALSPEDFLAQVRSVGCAIAAQSARLVPADRRLYALRDQTGTVESLGLVATSIVSKKIAGGAPAIAYDVKAGRGALFELAQARRLADLLVRLTAHFGRRASAIVSDMDEPLGCAIGTGLEVLEAVAFLRGERRDPRLSAVCERVALEMLKLGGFAGDSPATLERTLANGAAFERFEAMLSAQGAEPGALPRLAPHARATRVAARCGGFVGTIDAPALGELARDLVERDGAGAGLEMRVRTGDAVAPGRTLAVVYGTLEASARVVAAFDIVDEPPAPRPLVYFESASGVARSSAERALRSREETR